MSISTPTITTTCEWGIPSIRRFVVYTGVRIDLRLLGKRVRASLIHHLVRAGEHGDMVSDVCDVSGYIQDQREVRIAVYNI